MDSMDSGIFTVGGVTGRTDSTMHSRDISKTADIGQVHYQTARTLQTFRHLGKLMYWALIVYVITMIMTVGPEIYLWWHTAVKSSFSQKEGLQYLGASTNVTRDDTGWPTKDSLAESAMRAQNAATAMLATAPVAPSKATFVVPREHMKGAKVLTPEEKLLAAQQHH